MIKPPIPSNELQRLETLRSLRLLDTPAEERFDRVTRLAQRAFSVPIALVSLVDTNRQWFKSRQGLEATETSRDISFCGHAILQDRIMVVNDASHDERFCDNPLVTCDPNIRFYAGYPISAPDGNRIGTLCVIDQEARDFSKEDLHLLRELGRMVEEELITESLATTDPITGLSNFYGFDMITSQLLPICERMEKPLSLLLYRISSNNQTDIDISANEITHLLTATFRESDIIARLSDDVYAVLLTGVDLHGAATAEQRFEQRLNERNREPSLGHELTLEFELAQAAYHPGRHATVQDLIDEAEAHFAEAPAQIA